MMIRRDDKEERVSIRDHIKQWISAMRAAWSGSLAGRAFAWLKDAFFPPWPLRFPFTVVTVLTLASTFFISLFGDHVLHAELKFAKILCAVLSVIFLIRGVINYVRFLVYASLKRLMLIFSLLTADVMIVHFIFKFYDAQYTSIYVGNKIKNYCKNRKNEDLLICFKKDYSLGDGAYYIIYDRYNQIGLPYEQQDPEWRQRAQPLFDSLAICYYQTVLPLGNNEYVLWRTCQ
jgi:hypothetical protein